MIDLKFDSVSKRYRIRQETAEPASGSGMLGKLRRLRKSNGEFAALTNVSFEVKRGEALGIIGHNGAGKSTILKLLSNITTPTEGEITINGRLAALLEVGSGFHPELTGRENTYLSGAILGMRRSEITEKLDSIVEFAGIRQFLDLPVKRYSSGMYVRLGFSIAAHLEPDILLLDEVLAVGDAAFQSKCKRRILELHEAGMTIIFISHDLNAVRNLCDRALLLERGKVIDNDQPDAIIRRYTQQSALKKPEDSPTSKEKQVEFLSVAFFDGDRNQVSEFATGDVMFVQLNYRVFREVANSSINIYFYSSDGWMRTQFSTAAEGEEDFVLPVGDATIEFRCDFLSLMPDVYHIDLTVERSMDKEIEEVEWLRQCASIFVEKGKATRGRFFMPNTWQISPAARDAPIALEFADKIS